MDHQDHHNHRPSDESFGEYVKFAGVIAGIILLAFGLTLWNNGSIMEFMTQFMGVFFVVFAVFKLLSLEMFALTYQGYDIIAKRFKLWGWVFPFVELLLGAAYLLLGNMLWLNLLVIVITGTASIGVIKELRRKSVLKCACLGTIIRLPLSKVSFVEDFVMFIMALAMIAFA